MKAIRHQGPGRKRQRSDVEAAENGTVARPPAKLRSPISPPTSLELRGITIHFPFKPYACQEAYMGKVLDALLRAENALLESPTGTGKTLCLLCAALAWQRDQAHKINRAPVIPAAQPGAHEVGPASSQPQRRTPTIIYASRTHSQLSQVVRELRNTRYRPKHAVLGSREQMCVNPKVKKTTSVASEINHDCNKLGTDRKCTFKNRLEGFTPPANEAGVAVFGTQPVLDMEDLVAMGKTSKICPFYYTRSLVEDAELILVPYNYIFDKDARSTTLADVPWDNSVVIFDEAHNLESFASESASFDLSNIDVAGCIQDIDRAVGFQEALGLNGSGYSSPENFFRLKALFLQLEEYIISLPSFPAAYAGEKMIDIFQKGMKVSHSNHTLLLDQIRKVTDIFMEVKGGKNSRGSPRLEHFVQCVKRVFGEPTEARCLAKAKSYRVHVSPKSKNSSRTISYWCFAPAEAMSDLSGLRIRSIIVTSGTLSPLESYAMELGLPFPHQLENPHIIPDDQVLVRVMKTGVSGKLLSSAYERRQQDEYVNELGNTLISLARVIPGGMLVFFPSYGVMENCLERWGGPSTNAQQSGMKKAPASSFFAARKSKKAESGRYSFPRVAAAPSTSVKSSIWRRLLSIKAVIVEPRQTSDLPDAIEEFHRHLGRPKSTGCVLFGVCRGKISEGIDFANDMCRAVIITGIPFAPAFDPKVKMKREFLNNVRASNNVKPSSEGGFGTSSNVIASLSGDDWYKQQAHRAVNQAVGRVIRNRNDYGAVLLLDSRFSDQRNRQGLSKWVRPHVQNEDACGSTIRSLVSFYRAAEQKFRESQKENVAASQQENPLRVILKYEEGGKESEFQASDVARQVAVVRRPTIGESTHATANYVPPSQIVARLDANVIGNDANKAVSRLDAQSASRYPHTGTEVQDGSNSATKPSKTAEKKTDKAFIASQFFDLAQQKLSAPDFRSFKVILVSLKKIGDQKDRGGFVRKARQLIRILLSRDGFEDRPDEGRPALLELFAELVPPEFKLDIWRATMIEAFDRSRFGSTSLSRLGLEKHKRVRSSAASLMLETWYRGEALPVDKFLRSAQHVLRLLIDHGDIEDVTRSFLAIIPHKFRRPMKAFSEELVAQSRITRLKHHEKLMDGKVDRARHIGLAARAPEKGIAENTVESRVPFASGATESSSVHSHKAPLLTPGTVKRRLVEAGTQTFTGLSPQSAERSINSNVPEGCVCAICEKPLQMPLIAPCGHFACGGCWSSWLVKSSTCHVCRSPTLRSSLAQVMFER